MIFLQIYNKSNLTQYITYQCQFQERIRKKNTRKTKIKLNGRQLTLFAKKMKIQQLFFCLCFRFVFPAEKLLTVQKSCICNYHVIFLTLVDYSFRQSFAPTLHTLCCVYVQSQSIHRYMFITCQSEYTILQFDYAGGSDTDWLEGNRE